MLDAKGRPDFSSLQMGSGPVTYIVFDVLQVDGRDVTALPYEDVAGCSKLVEPGPHWLVSPRHADGDALMDAAKDAASKGSWPSASTARTSRSSVQTRGAS